jgi:hypothetical protein
VLASRVMRAAILISVVALGCGHHAADSTLATVDGDVTALGSDGTSLYAAVMKLGKASIVRIAKSGGAPETVVASTGLVRGLAARDGTLAWAETSVESDGSGATLITGDQIAKAGGIAEAVSAATDHPARILTVPLAGGTPTERARLAAVPAGLAEDDKDFYVLSLGTWPKGGDIDVNAGSLIAVPLVAGAPRVVADHLVRASQLALGPADLSWTANGQRWKVGKSGGTPQRTGTASGGDLVELVDGATTYRVVKDKSGELTSIVAHQTL